MVRLVRRFGRAIAISSGGVIAEPTLHPKSKIAQVRNSNVEQRDSPSLMENVQPARYGRSEGGESGSSLSSKHEGNAKD